MLNWAPSYDLGHEGIDAEHRILRNLIVDFREAAIKGAPKEELISIVDEIGKYAKFHFVNEENIMTEIKYPDQSHHVHLHDALIKEVNENLIKFKLGEIESNDMFEFLLNWFALHTSHEDKELVSYLHRSDV